MCPGTGVAGKDKHMREAEYQIVEGRTHRVLRTFTGTWSECQKETRHGEYARRTRVGGRKLPVRKSKITPLHDAEKDLARTSLQVRRRKQFLRLPPEERVEEIVWEFSNLTPIGKAQALKQITNNQ